jgi:hypothetical protein
MDEVKMIVESAIEAPSDTDAAVVVAFLIAQGVTKKTDLDAFDSIDELKFEATFVEKKRMLKDFRGGAFGGVPNITCSSDLIPLSMICFDSLCSTGLVLLSAGNIVTLLHAAGCMW